MELAALLVSIVALLLSWHVYRRQHEVAQRAAAADEKAADAQTRIATIEEARHTAGQLKRQHAKLNVRFDPAGTDGHMLVIANESATATAYDVTIDLEPRAPGAAPELRNSPFPATIPPRAETPALLSEGLHTATQLTGTLKWRNGAGWHEERRDLSIH